MSGNEILEQIRELSSSQHLPIKIDSLALMVQLERVDLVSYLVDLTLEGHIFFDKEHVVFIE